MSSFELGVLSFEVSVKCCCVSLFLWVTHLVFGAFEAQYIYTRIYVQGKRCFFEKCWWVLLWASPTTDGSMNMDETCGKRREIDSSGRLRAAVNLGIE